MFTGVAEIYSKKTSILFANYSDYLGDVAAAFSKYLVDLGESRIIKDGWKMSGWDIVE